MNVKIKQMVEESLLQVLKKSNAELWEANDGDPVMKVVKNKYVEITLELYNSTTFRQTEYKDIRVEINGSELLVLTYIVNEWKDEKVKSTAFITPETANKIVEQLLQGVKYGS